VVRVNSGDRGFFISVVLVYFLGSWVLLYIRVSSKLPVIMGSIYSWFEKASWDRGFFIFVVRVNFLGSWVLYISGFKIGTK
jgi:hypothetical protein